MIRVLLVDDQKTVRESLKISLEPEVDIEVIGTANDGIVAINQVEALLPDVVIMNMEMPALDGASATKQITSRFPETKVLILTSFDGDEYITKSLAMGAKGYLLKSVETQDLISAIRNAHKGYTQIAPGLIEKLLVATDSGVVLSKLSKLSPLNDTNITSIATKPYKTISSLQLASRQQQEEIAKLRHNIDDNQQELPQIKRTLSRHNRSIWLISLLWLISLPLLGASLFKLYNKTNNLQLSVIPTERVGIDGKFSLNGIAQRVANEYKQDRILKDISTVHVSQEEDAIVLSGSISDEALLKRMENIAKEVMGVRYVYTSQVDIKPNLKGNILGAENYRQ